MGAMWSRNTGLVQAFSWFVWVTRTQYGFMPGVGFLSVNVNSVRVGPGWGACSMVALRSSCPRSMVLGPSAREPRVVGMCRRSAVAKVMRRAPSLPWSLYCELAITSLVRASSMAVSGVPSMSMRSPLRYPHVHDFHATDLSVETERCDRGLSKRTSSTFLIVPSAMLTPPSQTTPE